MGDSLEDEGISRKGRPILVAGRPKGTRVPPSLTPLCGAISPEGRDPKSQGCHRKRPRANPRPRYVMDKYEKPVKQSVSDVSTCAAHVSR